MKVKSRPANKPCTNPEDREFSHKKRDDKTGDENWLYMSIKGRRREVLREQMVRHIRKMKVFKFDFRQ